MANSILKFRRHLAVCALVLLINEIPSIHKTLNGNIKQQRVKLASAQSQQAQLAFDLQTNNYQQKRQQHELNPNDDFRKDYYRMTDDDDDFDIIEFFLSFVGSYMPFLNLNLTILEKEFDNQQLDIEVENYYKLNFPLNMTLDQLQLTTIKSALRTAPMPIHLSWGYESRKELRMASLPVQDDERCAAHLSQISNRLDKITSAATSASANASPSIPLPANDQSLTTTPIKSSAFQATPVENFEAAQLYKSTDIPFLRYLDTFGKVPSDSVRGNMRWYGSYSGCLDTKLKANPQFGGTRRIKFRYCMAALKSVAWPESKKSDHTKSLDKNKMMVSSNTHGVHSKDIKLNNNFVRIGVCLPESCDSSALDYQENWHNIEKLLKFNLMKPYNSDHYYMSDLYCVPDRRSPLRTIPIMGKLLILATLGWLGLIGLATMVQLNVEKFYTRTVKEIRMKQRKSRVTSHSGSNVQSDGENSSSGGDLIDHADKSSSAFDLGQDEFNESDILGLKRFWIRVNVYIWDLSKNLIKGVDLIACLSLYSNWLKYTSRLKIAIVKLHEEQERRERIVQRDQRLIDEARNGKQATNMTKQQHQVKNSSLAGSGNQSNEANEAFDKELGKRLKAQDDSDEFNSDNTKRRVDTSSLNALKVIALFWIIAGHCIFYLASTVSNSAMIMNYIKDLTGYALAFGALYITELFFVITGCLTAYLSFKYNTYRADPEQHRRQVKINSNNQDEVELTEQTTVTKSAIQGTTDENNKTKTGGGKRNKMNQRNRIDSTISDQQQTLQPAYLESRIFKLPFWLMIIINRYLRILPTYLLVYCYVRLISVYIGGQGQLWDYAVSPNSMRRECAQESWLPILTLTTNFVNIYNHCIVGGWYLSTDFQLMLLSVPLLLVMAHCQTKRSANGKAASNLDVMGSSAAHKQQFTSFNKTQQQLTISSLPTSNGAMPSSKNEIVISKRLFLGYSFIVILGSLSVLLAIIYGLVNSQIDFSYILKFVPHTVALLSRNIAMYTNSLLRFRSFAFGLMAGHLLYLYEFKLIKLPRIIQLHGAKITTIVFSIGFLMMFTPVIYPQSKYIVSHDFVAVVMILTASGIDLFLSVLILLVCIGKAPKAVLFVLNSPFWSVLSSLSLCAFLVHTEVIVILTNQLNPPPTVQYSLLLFVFCATLVLTYILALGLYLSFELPVSRLIEAIMRKYFSSSKLAKSDNPS